MRNLVRFMIIPMVAFGVGAGISAAHASTAGCTEGTFSGYCGTQVDHEGVPLAMTSAGQASVYNNHVNAYYNTSNDPGNDFVNLQFKGDNSLGVMFMYAPGGVPAVDDGHNLCVADPDDPSLGASADSLVLRYCNGSNYQRWVASQAATGFTWINRASGKIIQSNGRSKQLTDVNAPATTLPTQEWTFAG